MIRYRNQHKIKIYDKILGRIIRNSMNNPLKTWDYI